MKNKKNYESMTIEEIEKRITEQEKKFVRIFETTYDEKFSAQSAGYFPDDDAAAVSKANKLLRSPRIKAYRHCNTLDLYHKRDFSREMIILRMDNLYLRSMQDVPHMTRNKETKEMEPDGTWGYESKDAISVLKVLGNVVDVCDKKSEKAGPAETVEEFMQRIGDFESEE
ncbi:MAG: hypothetical protein ACYCWE_20700 [Eubacteriales bacterium]